MTRYLGKCFEGIDAIDFDQQNEHVLSYRSSEHEQIALRRRLSVVEGDKKGNAEKWLSELEESMKESLKYTTKQAHESLKT